MTPTQNVSTQNGMHRNAMNAASTITLLAGIWFFISPWVYRSYMMANSWNSWIVGAVIVILAAIRLGTENMQSTQGLSWLNALLGIWAFISPWVYGYEAMRGRFINSLCVGVIVFVAALSSAMATPHHDRHAVMHS